MANRFFVPGTGNWGDTASWSTTSGGAGGASVPTSADAVFLDASSPNCTVDTLARSCLSLDCTGYTHTLTLSQDLTVSGAFTLSAGMTVTGAGTLIQNGTSTLTANGAALPRLNFLGTGTRTISGELKVGTLLTYSSNGGTYNGSAIRCSGSVTALFTTANVGGTSELILDGSGTLDLSALTTGSVAFPLTFNTAGTITVSGALRYRGGPLKHVAGTVTCPAGLVLTSTATVDAAGITWPSVTHQSSTTLTLSSALNVVDLTYGVLAGNSGTTINGADVQVSGNLLCTVTNNSAVSGTSTFRLTGTGTWSMPFVTTGSFRHTTVITGNYALSGTIRYRTGTLSVTTGTIVAGSGDLLVDNTCTLDLAGATLRDFTFNGSGGTVTLNSSFQCRDCLLGDASNTNTFLVNGSSLYISRNLTFSQSTSSHAGTTNLVMNGTGAISTSFGSGTSNTNTGAFRNPIEINTTGTVTFSGILYYNTGTLTYTAGTVVSAGATLHVNVTGVTLTANGAGVVWPTVLLSSDNAYDLTLTLNGTQDAAIRGIITTSPRPKITMKAGRTYTVYGWTNVTGAITVHGTWSSDTASSPAYVKCLGIPALLVHMNLTDLDFSQGKPVSALSCTLTRTAGVSDNSELVHPYARNPHTLPTAWRD